MVENDSMRTGSKILAFYWACLKHAVVKSWTLADTVSGIISLVLPILLWLLPGLLGKADEKLLQNASWEIPTLVAGLFTLYRLIASPYVVYSEKVKEAAQLREQLRSSTPNLGIDLRFVQQTGLGCMGEEIGKVWEETHGFFVHVTNLGPRISISRITLFYDSAARPNCIMPPRDPHPSLPQPLEQDSTITQSYQLAYELYKDGTSKSHFEELLNLSPRVVVKTLCGKEFKVESAAFNSMKSVEGSDWTDAIIREHRPIKLRGVDMEISASRKPQTRS